MCGTRASKTSSAISAAPGPDAGMRGVTWLRRHRVAVSVAAALVCFGLYGFALYAQHVLGYEPCPLCIFQRYGINSLGVALLLAAGLALLSGRRWAGIVSVVLILLSTALAAGVAGRHVYVQAQPAGTYESCGASLEWMLEINPLLDVVRKVLTAPGDCANIDWSFLGLAMPAWVLLWALALGALGVVLHWPGRAGRG